MIVFWAPNIALPDRETLENQHRARTMLPEEVLGQALLYVVAAVGRRVVFEDPHRFGAALYDEAWALLASPFGRKLLVEGVRDGRKHNGAIWLASQLASDFEISELLDLLGARFVFDQSHGAIPAALRFLGVRGSSDASAGLAGGLREGQCLYRDVRSRIGLVQVLPPALADVRPAFDTTPGARLADNEVGQGAKAPRPLRPQGSPPAAGAADHGPDTARDSAAEGPHDWPVGPRPQASVSTRRNAADAARARARRRRRSPLAQALAESSDR
jgi:hypothetical protein